jgi:hypothetical protein
MKVEIYRQSEPVYKLAVEQIGLQEPPTPQVWRLALRG